MSLDAEVPPQAIKVYRVFSEAGHGQVGWVGAVHYEDMLDKNMLEFGR